jgi:aerobic carbon-monoxide dehydrogenase medium subunit
MQRFKILQPDTIAEASSLLLNYEDSRAVAGGTALVILMKEGLLRPSHLVALHHIRGLNEVSERDGAFVIGSMVTQHTLEISTRIRDRLPVLAEAAAKVGNIRVRTVSTVGGSLCEGDYQSDLAPTLSVLGARVLLHGPRGGRTAPVEEFLRDAYEVDLARGEIATAVEIPMPPEGSTAVYLKHVTGPITDRPCLGVAVLLSLASDGTCRTLRVGLSSVMGFSSRPLVIDGAAIGVTGRAVDEESIQAVAQAAYDRADPPSDLRASGWYRKQMVRVFVRRAIVKARTAAGRPVR